MPGSLRYSDTHFLEEKGEKALHLKQSFTFSIEEKCLTFYIIFSHLSPWICPINLFKLAQ